MWTYDLVTGRVLSSGRVPIFLVPLQAQNCGVIAEALDPNTQMVDINIQTAAFRPAFTLTQNKTSFSADSIDEWVLSNLPKGTTVVWPDGEVTVIDDGELRFSVDLIGTYKFTVDAFPYLKMEVSVEAIP